MATADLLIDTDVLIDHLRGRRRLPTADRSGVSVVSRCELFARRDDEGVLRALLSTMIELPITSAIAELAGRIRRQCGIATPDALIAATAIAHQIPVMSRNERHFRRVDGLELVSPS